MNKENAKLLIERYPKLYRQSNLPMTETCMCWGFECGDGWFDLINELSAKLEPLNVEAVQVKEKFGGLRFYTTHYTEESDKLISEAETLSEETCEVCGKPGYAEAGGWISTRCDECR